MTDPNVLKALRLICNAAYHAIPGNDSTGSGMALTLLDKADALLAAAEKPAAAPTVAAVVPVLFNGTGRAMLASGERATQTGPEGWSAEVSPDRKWLAIFVGLRPGEDAGETVAKMLAPVGRGL